jgi:hypothetical protein
VKVDGDAREWSLPLRYYDEGTKMFFAFANDSNYVYLCFQSNDVMMQRKLLAAGMSVTLSTKGKPKRKATIAFPMGGKGTFFRKPEGDNKTEPNSKQAMRNSFLAQNRLMNVKGFSTREGVISIKDSSGLVVAIDWDNTNKLIYEIGIPLKELYGNDYTAQDLLNPLMMTAEVNALEKPSSDNKEGGSSGGRRNWSGGGGGHGGGGGGMHRGAGGGYGDKSGDTGPSDREKMFEKGKFSQKFLLTDVRS